MIMGAQTVMRHALIQGRSTGPSLAKSGDTPVITQPMIILGATDGMGGGRECLPRPVPMVTRRLARGVGKADALVMIMDALSIPHRDHFGDSADGWETYSVRAVTGLRLLCPADHSDGGFVETGGVV